MELAAISSLTSRGILLDHAISKKAKLLHLPLSTGKLFNTANSKRMFFTARASLSSVAENSNSDLSLPVDKKIKWRSFPGGFENLVLDVCDETEIAEVLVKVGTFEMHLKRNVGAPPKLPTPATAPPIPGEPMGESALASPASTPKKSSPEVKNHLSDISPRKWHKFASLDASGTAYVVVKSSFVGSFRSGKTTKGKRQPPCCKEGDVIKEGQVIGFIEQFKKELPLKSDVDGEILKVLVKDEEAIGFGDPILAVLPSFHNINKF